MSITILEGSKDMELIVVTDIDRSVEIFLIIIKILNNIDELIIPVDILKRISTLTLFLHYQL